MTSQFLKPGRSRPSRAASLAVITAVHAALIVGALAVRGPARDEASVAPIAVSLLTEPQATETPLPKLRTPEVAIPVVQVPLLEFDIPVDAPPPPIAVVARAEPPAPPPQPVPSVAKADSSEPVMATSVQYVRPPVLVYPAAAKQARASGTVHVRAVVEADGRVRDVKVDRSSGHALLDKAATEAMRGALFRPYMHNGVARAAVVIVPMDFGLKSRNAKREKEPAPAHCGGLPQRDPVGDSCTAAGGSPPMQVISQAVAE